MRRIFYVPAVLVLFIACNKYEDGPDFSLRSKSERISKNWIVSTVYVNGADQTMGFNSKHPHYQLNIARDKQYSMTYELNPTELYVEKGTWNFNDHKTHVIFSNSDGKEVDYTIKRLDSKDLRFTRVNEEGHEVEMWFTPKPE